MADYDTITFDGRVMYSEQVMEYLRQMDDELEKAESAAEDDETYEDDDGMSNGESDRASTVITIPIQIFLNQIVKVLLMQGGKFLFTIIARKNSCKTFTKKKSTLQT